MNTMELEEKNSINAWHEFTQHLQQTTPNIFQTTVEINTKNREEGTIESISGKGLAPLRRDRQAYITFPNFNKLNNK